MSFQPGQPRSAYVTRDPSGSRRSSRPSGEETITRWPSGSHAVHSGRDRTRAITSLRPARSTASTSPADQSEKYSRSPCHRGDSTSPRPVSNVRTVPIRTTALLRVRYHQLHERRPPGSTPQGWSSGWYRSTTQSVVPGRRRPGTTRGSEGAEVDLEQAGCAGRAGHDTGYLGAER